MRFIFVVATGLLLALPCLGQEGRPNLIKKNPWMAVALSVLVPGAGQLYNDERTKAWSGFAVALAGGLVIYSALEDNGEHCILKNREEGEILGWFPGISSEECRGAPYSSWHSFYDFDGDDGRGALGGLIYMGAWWWSVLDAAMSASRINAEAESPSALEIVPLITPDRTGARVVMRF